MAAFTHYWEVETCRANERFEGEPCDHTASNVFKKRGVKVGDRVYIVNIRTGQLHLIGRLEVGRVIPLSEARRVLPYEPWVAEDHLLANPGTATPMRFHRVLPLERARELAFQTRNKVRGLRFLADGRLDGQTLRGVRRLTANSAEILESVLT